MSIFCTRCGTENGVGDAFCQNCGSPLRKPVNQSERAPSAAVQDHGASLPSRRIGIWAAIGMITVTLIGGGLYFLAKQPDASPENLLMAAQADLGDVVQKGMPGALCLGNMDYAAEAFNVAEYDSRTLAWLDMLTAAGLYQKVGMVLGGNAYVPQTLVQYKPTAVAQKWRQGNQLCLARKVRVAAITDIGEPRDDASPSGSAGRHTVRAKVVVETEDLAAWIDKPGVSERMLPLLPMWSRSQQQLRLSRDAEFVVRDGKWHVDTESQRMPRKPLKAEQDEASTSPSPRELGLWGRIKSLFGMHAHPLEGTWAVDTEAMPEIFGHQITREMDIRDRLTFTADACEVERKQSKCRFVTEGRLVKVYAEGTRQQLVFEVVDDDTVKFDVGLLAITYKRVQ